MLYGLKMTIFFIISLRVLFLLVIAFGIERFLMTYVPLYLLLFKTYRRYRIPSGPELLAIEISLPSPKLPCDGYCTFSLDIPYHLGDSLLRRYLDQHVHMVSHHMPFHYLTASMPGHFMKHRSKKLPYLSVQYLLAPFGYKHYMILAIPFRMT